MDLTGGDFTTVYMEPLQQNTVTTGRMTTPSSSIELGTLIPHDIAQTRVDLLERRVAELEKIMQTVTRNIEVMQQNTQVISKGFNILSIRVNKVTADHDTIHTHMGKGYKVIEEKVQDFNKVIRATIVKMKLQHSKGELEIGY
jgi:hypothetical protein